MTANGIYKFVCGGDCLWNFFDVIIVALHLACTQAKAADLNYIEQ